jgi:hypothetical protein
LPQTAVLVLSPFDKVTSTLPLGVLAPADTETTSSPLVITSPFFRFCASLELGDTL